MDHLYGIHYSYPPQEEIFQEKSSKRCTWCKLFTALSCRSFRLRPLYDGPHRVVNKVELFRPPDIGWLV
jgi:hypothetical protein